MTRRVHRTAPSRGDLVHKEDDRSGHRMDWSQYRARMNLIRLANAIDTAIRVRVGVGAFASTDNWNLIRRQFPHDSVSLHTADQALMFL
jgi:hypothetical protein